MTHSSDRWHQLEVEMPYGALETFTLQPSDLLEPPVLLYIGEDGVEWVLNWAKMEYERVIPWPTPQP